MPGVAHKAWPGVITEAVAADPDHACSGLNTMMPPGRRGMGEEAG